MNVVAYTWTNNPEETALLKKIVLNTLGVEEFTIITGQQIATHKPNPSSILLCFGTRAFNIISANYPTAIRLPLLSQLVDVPNNEEYRLEAYITLKKLLQASANPMDTQIELNKEDILENLSIKSKNLIKHLTEDKTEYWIGTTELEKKVLISSTPIKHNVTCNFQLTFEELYAAKLAVELLNLKSITLVKETKDD